MNKDIIFKVGDKVKFIEEYVKKVNDDVLPEWYTTDTFTIKEIDPLQTDVLGYSIVTLKEELIHCSNSYNKVTSYYLKPAIQEMRKLKLKQINESNMR